MSQLAPHEAQAAREEALQRLGLDTMNGEFAAAAGDPDPTLASTEAARRYFRRFDARLAGAPDFGDKVACKKGCASCCHLRVEAPAQEVFALADAVRALPDEQREAVMVRLRLSAISVASMSANQHLRTPTRCALLDGDGACSVYDDRPTACRRCHSLSVQACEASLARPDDLSSRLPISTARLVVSMGQAFGFRTAQSRRGIDTTHYELHTALLEALCDGEASAARFARGEAAFVAAIRIDE